ncbi:pseudouridylate synthase [Chitinophaga sp. SYP-B3965]|uniref:pseudouridylate synthase n=1 Tax=Chitinophaga sp. SYP-B3965 TaxID=2663120 RepID=UPI001299EA5F|nr:pseudouridylate synthase [Chitinophaga sp. SYP-B3965]MRG44508.1 pseudouridylate synthase [Chitinophaga sp. SYP-B3965]
MTSVSTAFRPFAVSSSVYELAEGLVLSLKETTPHPLCLLAVSELQLHLQYQQEWEHNFGLLDSDADEDVIGKMFGVLVVRTSANELGYLAAFSGKLAGGNHHAGFVPPVFDGLVEGGFVNEGMKRLTEIIDQINDPATDAEQVRLLKILRKEHSIALQYRIFEQYHFLNKMGELKSLIDIFGDRKPPAGAGECAAPKLLQYAFQHQMEPLALAEFWWGASPKSDYWKHGEFYAPCQEKCSAILAHMLQ